jgi:1-acyl-sn-glycerol-3-phosphate acyltransferase
VREPWYDATVGLGRLLFAALGLERSIEDAEHLPRTGPVIVAAAHVAYPDFMTLAEASRTRGRNLRFLTRHDVWYVPVARHAMTRMRHVPVDREAPAAAYFAARRLLRDGEAVGLFPEAGISHAYAVRAMMPGAVALARETGAPIVPVAQWGIHRVWSVGRPVAGRKPRPSLRRGRHNDLRFGLPLHVTPDADLRAATHDLGVALTALLEELQLRPHHRPRPGERAPWYPAHLGGHAPDRREALGLDSVPGAAVRPTWGPRH